MTRSFEKEIGCIENLDIEALIFYWHDRIELVVLLVINLDLLIKPTNATHASYIICRQVLY